MSIIKKFKEKIYLGVFNRFNESNEMLAAITVNALRNLNENERQRLAIDMGLRINKKLRKELIHILINANDL